ncbi:MAG: hypothetical protein NTV86_05175 [Planctomycetota bacterium]|nr:hypothetical protein [Planctomycetota bacterium]
MKQENDWDDGCEVDDAPVSVAVAILRPSKYGGLVDLPDEELADPEELEQQVMAQEWGPVLALPVKGHRGSFRVSVDESGRIEGAFGSADFDRIRPEFDKARHKAGKLREKLGDLLILIGIVKERLPGKAAYLVLKYLRMGIIEPEHIVNDDMQSLAKLHLRARHLEQEIAQLEDASRAKPRRRPIALLGP